MNLGVGQEAAMGGDGTYGFEEHPTAGFEKPKF